RGSRSRSSASAATPRSARRWRAARSICWRRQLTGLLNLIGANQPVKGFYAGFHQADFAWLAQSSIKTWADLKGGTVGVSTFGSLTDQLTRYVLRKHGLKPETDVRIMQAGPSATSIQLLRSGRLLAAIQSAPTKWA